MKLGFLLIFTKIFDCWEWTAAEVIRKIIKPLKEDAPYRVVGLPCMKGHTSRAKNLSYAQADTWGDLIAALLDGGADLERCVWLDVCHSSMAIE